MAIDAAGGAVGDANGDVTVEIGGGEAKLLRGAVSQVGDRGGDDVAAPGIFYGDGQSHGDAQIACLPGTGETAELADLDVDHVHRPVGMRPQQHVDAIHGFVEDEGKVGAAADGETFLVGEARLLDVDVKVAQGAHDADGLVRQPAGVGVGDQDIARLEFFGHGANALDVGVRVRADLQLKAAIAFGAVTGHSRRHGVGLISRYGAVESDPLAVTPAQQGRYRLAGDDAQDVPAGHVDGRFHVGMALEEGVHAAVEFFQLDGVLAQQVRRDLGDACPRSGGVGGQVDGAERADFAHAGYAVVGLDEHDGAVEHFHGLPARPLIGTFVEGQVHLVGGNAANLHPCLRSGVGAGN